MPWSQRTTEINSRPASVLIDDRFRARLPVQELPRLARFCIYCCHDPGSSFWHPDETTSLDAVEDELVRLCDIFGHGWAVYVIRIDTHGIREYYLHCGESATLAHVLPSLRAAHPDYRIEFEETDDTEWNRSRTLLPDHEPSA